MSPNFAIRAGATAILSLLVSVPVFAADPASLTRVSRNPFGKTRDGIAVEQVTLRNSRGLTAKVITYGAILQELQAPDRKGNLTNIVLSTDTIGKYEQGFGGAAAVIGRVANRIAGAQFELEGRVHQLAANNGKNSIHGGNKGFAQVVWTVEELGPQAQESAVRLTYLSRDGEEGYPGNLKVSVTYTLTDDNALRIDYGAESDRATIVNLTNHAYWNLAGGGSCLDNVLSIPSAFYTPNDSALIPTGEIRSLEGTPMDFRKPTRIGERFDRLPPGLNGYDHNFLLGTGGEMRLAARLLEPRSGRILEVHTTEPAIQLYTGNHLGHTAVCLETQHYPDSIHHPHFPSTVVRPGKPLRETALFTLRAE
jgi:aldose 1-epimerase